MNPPAQFVLWEREKSQNFFPDPLIYRVEIMNSQMNREKRDSGREIGCSNFRVKSKGKQYTERSSSSSSHSSLSFCCLTKSYLFYRNCSLLLLLLLVCYDSWPPNMWMSRHVIPVVMLWAGNFRSQRRKGREGGGGGAAKCKRFYKDVNVISRTQRL